MPPRYAYWTILIDDKPTAFRAREREELLPTLQQLKHTNPNAVMKWFARGKLWDTREQEQAAHQWRKNAASASGSPEPLRGAQPPSNRAGGGAPARPREGGAPREKDKEKRGRDWRPGGAHKDPRARFDKRKKGRRAGLKGQPEGDRRPWRDKPAGPPRGDRPSRPPGSRPAGPPADRRPWQTARPEGDRRPWGNKPSGPPRGGGRPPDRRGAWEKKPAGQGDRKPWQKDAPGSKRDRRRVDLPGRRIPGVGGSGPPVQNEPSKRREEPKRRDESPDKPPAPEQIVTKPKPPERG